MQEPARVGPALRALWKAGAALGRLPRPLAVVPVALWMALIWSLSNLPASQGEHTWVGALVANLAHAPLFGLLALWVALLLPREGGWPRLDARRCAVVLAVVLAYAVVDELHQASSPGRDPSYHDVLTDGVGAACVLWVAAYARSGGATERGLWARLLAGVLLCVAAAALATFEPFTQGGAPVSVHAEPR